MKRERQLLATMSLVTALLAAAPAAGQDRGPMPTIIVRVDDKAGLEGSLLTLAESRTAQVFAMSGIHIEWIDGREAIRFEFATPYTILLMAEASSKVKAKIDGIEPDVTA